MKDKEYELWNKYGATQKEECILLGPHASYEWQQSRRQLLFTAARYKFAMKMIGSMYEPGEKEILDLGCSDGFGTYYVAEFAKFVLGVDFDRETIEYAKKAYNGSDIRFELDNFLDGREYGAFDAVVSFDVLEHIFPENESLYMKTVMRNLKEEGVFIVGTPSLESQRYSKENVRNAHVNCYKGEDFYHMLKHYFNNVFLFTQNDEIIHTGYMRMANYLIGVCTNKRME